ncbi:MAG: glycosyltransferase family 39 protein [Xenococcaceae cyanobacterium MO_207.B15]|nr:glycosyltransferase family 39 protein [Xenococcaceae cyanobacterium MO_207.B15]
MSFVIPIVILIEIIIFCLGVILLIYLTGEKVSESVSKGIFLSIIIFSFFFQLSFILGHPNFSFILEGITTFICILIIRRNLSKLQQISTSFWQFSQQYKIISLIIISVWIYLCLQAILLPPGNWDSMTYNLARVLLFQQEKSIFLTQVSYEPQAVHPVGADILHHAFLRFYTDYGIGIFSFLAYLSIAFGTYALARRYASRQYSFVATLIIISLPELVLQSTSTKNDIFTVASAIFCLISVHRIITRINLDNLLLLPVGLAFGISCKTTFIAFAFPFVCFFSILVLKKYSFSYLLNIIKKYKLNFGFIILPIFIFLPILTYLHNYLHFGTWAGSFESLQWHQQSNGLRGALANLVRYVFQSIDFLEISNLISINSKNIYQVLFDIYSIFFNSLFGQDGINKEFTFAITSLTSEDMSWFGPFGFFIVIPSIFYCLIKGDLYLRSLSLNLLSYIVIVSYKLAWQPFNNRFFSLFFVSSGVLIAYSLQQFKIKSILLKLLTFLAIIILIYTTAFNLGKPLMIHRDLNPLNWIETVTKESIWSKTNFGKNRTYYSDIHGFPEVNILSQFIPSDSEVALVTNASWVYYYLLYNPNIKITPFQVWDPYDPKLIKQLSKFNYIFYLDISYEPDTDFNDLKILWSSEKGIESKLIQVIQ